MTEIAVGTLNYDPGTCRVFAVGDLESVVTRAHELASVLMLDWEDYTEILDGDPGLLLIHEDPCGHTRTINVGLYECIDAMKRE